MRVFVSHRSKDSEKTLPVVAQLARVFGGESVFSYEDDPPTDAGFIEKIYSKAAKYEIFLCFLGEELSHWQTEELGSALGASEHGDKHFLTIAVSGQDTPPHGFPLAQRDFLPDRYSGQDAYPFVDCAIDILRVLAKKLALPRPITFHGPTDQPAPVLVREGHHRLLRAKVVAGGANRREQAGGRETGDRGMSADVARSRSLEG